MQRGVRGDNLEEQLDASTKALPTSDIGGGCPELAHRARWLRRR